jgi:hypothetical protein
MTVIRARLDEELEQALECYQRAHPDAAGEAIMQRALKRFLLEEGYLVEDEPLSDAELEALQAYNGGESDYVAWDDVKDDL